MKYRLTFANGEPTIEVEGALSVTNTLRAKYGGPVYVATSDGDGTMFWRTEADYWADDDTALVLGWVRKVGA